MSALDRLLAEELPTGTFGDAHPTPKPSQRQPRPWTAQEQADHRRSLEAALDNWHWTDNPRHPRHLTPVPDQPAA